MSSAWVTNYLREYHGKLRTTRNQTRQFKMTTLWETLKGPLRGDLGSALEGFCRDFSFVLGPIIHLLFIFDSIKLMERLEIFQCNFCPHKFTPKQTLRRHIKSKYGKSENTCRIFVERHIKAVHDQSKFQCNLCLNNSLRKQFWS